MAPEMKGGGPWCVYFVCCEGPGCACGDGWGRGVRASVGIAPFQVTYPELRAALPREVRRAIFLNWVPNFGAFCVENLFSCEPIVLRIRATTPQIHFFGAFLAARILDWRPGGGNLAPQGRLLVAP